MMDHDAVFDVHILLLLHYITPMWIMDHGSWIMDQPIGCHGHGRRCHDRFLQLFIPFHR